MDVQLLSQAFLATLDPDAATRAAAELHLATCESSPYILASCLTIAKDFFYPAAVQQAAAVFLKNLIARHWKISGAKHIRNPSPLLLPAQHQDQSQQQQQQPQQQQQQQQQHQEQQQQVVPTPSPPPVAFSASTRTEFKQLLLFTLPQVTPEVQAHLVAVIATVLSADLPRNLWPEFLPTVISMLRTPESMYAGVLCAAQLFRYYSRLKPHQQRQSRAQYESAVGAVFPILYQIASIAPAQDPPLALWKVVKCYRYVVTAKSSIPAFLQSDQELKNWLSLLMDILKRPIGTTIADIGVSPQHQQEQHEQQQNEQQQTPKNTQSPAQSFGSPAVSVSSEDECESDSIKRFAWMKCKKWACHVLTHLMVTACGTSTESAFIGQSFGNSARLTSGAANPTASIYLTYFAPEVCNIFIKEIEKWQQETPEARSSFLSIDSALINVFTYLDLAQTVPDLWSAILLPNMSIILSNLIFQTLLLSPDDIELMHSQPDEYIAVNIENAEFTPRTYARRLLSHIMKFHADQVLNGFFQFINEIIAKYHTNRNDYTLAVQKDAVLQMMAAVRRSFIVSGKSSNTNTANAIELFTHQMESFLVHHTSLDKSSQYAFLRARACETIAAFGQFEMPLSDLENVYTRVLPCLADTEVVVQFQAVMAIQQLARYPYVHAALADPQQVSNIMVHILEIYNKGVDSERVALVMADLIADYTEQLVPFAAGMAKQLADQFVRIAGEVISRSESDEGFTDDKNMAASGILDTLHTLLAALGRDKSAELRPTLIPVFSIVLSNAQEDFYQEVFDLIELLVPEAQQQQSPRPDDGEFLNQLCGLIQAGSVANPAHAGEYFIPCLCTLIETDVAGTLCTETNTKFFFELGVRYASTPGEYKKRGLDFSQLIIFWYCKLERASECVDFYISQLLDLVPTSDVLGIFVAAVSYNPFGVPAYVARTGRLAAIVHEYITVFGHKFTKVYEKKLVASGLLKFLSTLPETPTLEPSIAYDLANAVAKYVIDIENLPLKTEPTSPQPNGGAEVTQFQFVDSGIYSYGKCSFFTRKNTCIYIYACLLLTKIQLTHYLQKTVTMTILMMTQMLRRTIIITMTRTSPHLRSLCSKQPWHSS